MKKHHAQHLEIRFAEPEAFALTVQSATDGDRIAKAKEQSEADRKAAEANQMPLV